MRLLYWLSDLRVLICLYSPALSARQNCVCLYHSLGSCPVSTSRFKLPWIHCVAGNLGHVGVRRDSLLCHSHSQWCKREEQFLRTSIWLGANELGLMVGSFMAYGQAANPPLTIAGWRLIFIITGVFTVVVSIIVLRNKKLKREQSIEALTDTRT